MVESSVIRRLCYDRRQMSSWMMAATQFRYLFLTNDCNVIGPSVEFLFLDWKIMAVIVKQPMFVFQDRFAMPFVLRNNGRCKSN